MAVKILRTPKKNKASTPKDEGATPLQQEDRIQNRVGSFERIYDLGAQKVRVIDAELTKGTAVNKVVRMIQNEWGDLNDVKTETLAKQLQRYKKSVIDPFITFEAPEEETPLVDTEPHGVSELVDASKSVPMDGGLTYRHGHISLTKSTTSKDALVEMDRLLELQKGRLQKVLLAESKLPTVMESAHKEMQLMSNLLDRAIKLQMDLGIITRVPKKVQVEATMIQESPERASLLQSKEDMMGVADVIGDITKILEGDFEDVTDITEE